MPAPRMRRALPPPEPGKEKTWVRDVRVGLGKSQEGFASALGVSASLVSRWERGVVPLLPRNVTLITRLWHERAPEVPPDQP